MDAQDHVRRLLGEGLNVDTIQAVLFEPVGCLAEFGAEEFNLAAAELGAASEGAPATGSLAYWRLLGLLGPRYHSLAEPDLQRLQELELQAVERADLYPDVSACLQELHRLGAAACLVSSLSRNAVQRFLDRFDLAGAFATVVAREEAGGVLAAPLAHAVAQAGLGPVQAMVLVDTAESLDLARSLGLIAMLMINDYDEGRALAERSPAGGIVSLAELPDALRLIEQRAGLAVQSRLPRQPFDLFDPT
jgi:beta-phosphoglucomutase-like phosphatase (HAD superfamily)